ncbi:MAG: hypothetical protein PVI54_00710, partial [Desulfobacteraceae bacterium]
MNNTIRHLGLLFFDLLSIVMIYIFFNDFKQTLAEINGQVDIVRFGNRDGFFIVGIGIPLMHLLIASEQLCPNFIKRIEKYRKPVNQSIMGFVVALLIAGFAISSWLQSRAENSGYVHCRYVSGVSALAKTLVYTKG